MNPRPARTPWQMGILALLAVVGVATLLCLIVNALGVVALLASPSQSDVPSHVVTPKATATVEAHVTPTVAPTIAAAHAAVPTTAALEFTGPVQVLADGTQIPIAPPNQTVGAAHRSWLTAMMKMDTGSALVLYRPADGGDALSEVSDHIALMYSAMHRPDPDPLGMGKLRDVRVVGDYAAPGATSLRYGIGEVIFEGGRLCVQATLSDAGEAGWHVRNWKPITVEECSKARAQIAAGDDAAGKEARP